MIQSQSQYNNDPSRGLIPDESSSSSSNTISNSSTTNINTTATIIAFEQAEEQHEYDALTTLLLNITITACLLLAYYVKKWRIYYLPESAGALLVGMLVGGLTRLVVSNKDNNHHYNDDRLELFEFSPEVFFFVLLPPIIFEAGYSLKRKDFFDNIGAITLYAMFGTIISTLVVGGLCFAAAYVGWVDLDASNPMEELLFGALISAVDPVATLSILGSAELNCDPLLYSLVFGESVLNDAVAISLFNVFAGYYVPGGPDFSMAQIPHALMTFVLVSTGSVIVGVVMGLLVSFIYKNTSISDFSNLETSLLFSFCYLGYSTAEAIGLSGIMALFFQGVTLSHYNSYNLSPSAHVASEQIFATLATIAETAVFLYMGMGVFTGRYNNFDIVFTALAMLFCWAGRFFNIFPLSWLANLCRDRSNNISVNMQCVLWFVGLRGAIAFALAMNMPGDHRDTYATTTLAICILTTVFCGGLTDRVLTIFRMKQPTSDDADDFDMRPMTRITGGKVVSSPKGIMGRPHYSLVHRTRQNVYAGGKKIWKQVDRDFLMPYFGGPTGVTSARDGTGSNDHLGNYELARQKIDDSEPDYYDDDDDIDDLNGQL